MNFQVLASAAILVFLESVVLNVCPTYVTMSTVRVWMV